MNIAVDLLVAALVGALVAGGSALVWRAGGSPNRPLDPATPARLIVVVYIVMYGIGSVVLAATGEAVAGPLVVGLAFMAMGVGASLARRWLGPVVGPRRGAETGSVRTLVVVVLAIVGLVAFGSLAIQYGLPLVSADPQAARGGYGGWRLDAFRWLVPPAALVALGLALSRGSRSAWLIVVASIGLVAGLEILAASRALPFELGIAALLMALWAGRRLGRRGWLAVGLTSIALFLGVQFARIGNEGGFDGALDASSFAVTRTINRVLLIHPRTIDIVVETFPRERPYMGGSTYVRWLSGLSGSPPPPALGDVLFRSLFPSEPPGGFAAPGLLGEAWANGGPGLAAILMVALGVVAVAVSRVVDGLSSAAVDRTFAAVLAVAIARTYATSLNGVVLTVLAIFVWWLFAGGRLRWRLPLMQPTRPLSRS